MQVNQQALFKQLEEFEKLPFLVLSENKETLKLNLTNILNLFEDFRYAFGKEHLGYTNFFNEFVHIKDRGNSICPISGKKNMIEKYADAFASELLMPAKNLKMMAAKYAINGQVDRDGILKIAEFFGVSFESAVFAVAYKTAFWTGEKDPKIIRKDNRKYKPEQRKIELGLDLENVNLWEQVVNSYEYFWSVSNRYAWYIFKNNFIYHENRLERLNLDEDVVAEIIADLRYNKSKSQYCRENCEEIIQVAGHSALYDYIYETTDKLDIYKIQKRYCGQRERCWLFYFGIKL